MNGAIPRNCQMPPESGGREPDDRRPGDDEAPTDESLKRVAACPTPPAAHPREGGGWPNQGRGAVHFCGHGQGEGIRIRPMWWGVMWRLGVLICGASA